MTLSWLARTQFTEKVIRVAPKLHRSSLPQTEALSSIRNALDPIQNTFPAGPAFRYTQKGGGGENELRTRSGRGFRERYVNGNNVASARPEGNPPRGAWGWDGMGVSYDSAENAGPSE
ncbi:hypothetical protein ACJRO7_018295 [Eucalyptus globulus]|uniref:Uncharacterized protein n=1 Tax=Eucalyptus globulus TaxID=34317 RepID=A0ABD3KU88_EUCGL